MIFPRIALLSNSDNFFVFALRLGVDYNLSQYLTSVLEENNITDLDIGNVKVFENVRCLERGATTVISHDDGEYKIPTSRTMFAEWDSSLVIVNHDINIDESEIEVENSYEAEWIADCKYNRLESTKRREAACKAIATMEELGYNIDDLRAELDEMDREDTDED